jgi:hypothetical protein
VEDWRKQGTGVDFLFDFLSCKKFHCTRGPPEEECGEGEAARGSVMERQRSTDQQSKSDSVAVWQPAGRLVLHSNLQAVRVMTR